jgi:hypothetical protein
MATKKIICSECKQDMNEEPHPGLNGKNCDLCGQGLHWRKALKKRILKEMVKNGVQGE